MGRLGRRILVAFLAVTFLPLAVMGGAAWIQARGVIEAYLAQDTQQKVRLWAADLDGFLVQQRAVLGALSLGEDSSDTQSMLDTAVARTSSLDGLVLMDDDGVLIASSPSPQDLSPWVVSGCRELVAQPQRVITHGGDDHAHQVVIASVPEGGGLLCGLVSFSLHQDMLAERARSVAGGTPVIVNRLGQVVCHAYQSTEQHVDRGHGIGGVAAQVAAAGQAWSGKLSGAHGVVYAAYAPATSLPWGIWVEIPAEVASASLSPLLRSAGLYALGFGLLVALFAVLASRSLVGPLGRVADAAMQMTAGRPGQTVPVTGADEVADLARQFNRMSLALAESYAELDDRVLRRTRQLAAARDFSDQLLDTMQERILVFAVDGGVVRANRSAVEAWGDDVVGLAWPDLQVRLGLASREVVCPVDSVTQSGASTSDEWVCAGAGHDGAGADGARDEILEVHSAFVPGVDGAADTVICLLRDVTSLRKLQGRLMHQEKMASLGMLSAGLAHEIGNPLASMSSELELLALDWDPDQARESLPVLQELVGRMAALLRELSDFGRRSRDELDEVQADAVVAKAVRLLGHDRRARGVTLDVRADPALPPILASEDRLIQVLVNLGINALDALDGRGSLVFSTRTTAQGTVEVEVIDDGPGMDSAVARRAFDPFYTTKAQGQGTGLGLFVSEQLVVAQGGQIRLHTQPGAGTRFVITLRAAQHPDEINMEAEE